MEDFGTITRDVAVDACGNRAPVDFLEDEGHEKA